MGVMPKNSTNTPVPEHSLRHREDSTISLTTSGCATPGTVMPAAPASFRASKTIDRKKAVEKPSINAWPFTIEDAPPTANEAFAVELKA
jgi:hypothetical protein